MRIVLGSIGVLGDDGYAELTPPLVKLSRGLLHEAAVEISVRDVDILEVKLDAPVVIPIGIIEEIADGPLHLSGIQEYRMHCRLLKTFIHD